MTGGNTGIGYGIVDAVASLGPSCIYLCARTKAKGDAAIASLSATHPSVRFEFLQLDLADVSNVKACAERFNNMSDRLDLLFLNAGVSGRAPGLTNDGYEIHFGVNYLGHILLTQLLMPKMLLTLRSNNGADVRVVGLTSMSGDLFQVPSDLALEQMKSPAAELSPILRYGHSKLAIMLAMRKLAQLYPEILFVSLCPGNVKTDLWAQTDGFGWFTNNVLAPLILLLTGISVEQAARLPLWCATEPRGGDDNDLQSGQFYHPKSGPPKDDNQNAQSQELCNRLWDWTGSELQQQGAPGWPSPS